VQNLLASPMSALQLGHSMPNLTSGEGSVAQKQSRLPSLGLRAAQGWHSKNPLRIAEEVATIDHLSEGRFEFGIGRSGSARSYDILGVPYGESQARFLEALEIIREAWKGRPFSYAGEFF
jgi:Luciferase-like monooxygenase